MKKFVKSMMAMALCLCAAGCGAPKNDPSTIYDNLTKDGYTFDYSYMEMQESDGRFYTLKIMPENFSLKDSSYIYYNVSDYDAEDRTDQVTAIVYQAKDGSIYGVSSSTQSEKMTMMNGTCFVDYRTMEVAEDASAYSVCDDETLKNMEAQKANLIVFQEKYGLDQKSLVELYNWYAENHKADAQKSE